MRLRRLPNERERQKGLDGYDKRRPAVNPVHPLPVVNHKGRLRRVPRRVTKPVRRRLRPQVKQLLVPAANPHNRPLLNVPLRLRAVKRRPPLKQVARVARRKQPPVNHNVNEVRLPPAPPPVVKLHLRAREVPVKDVHPPPKRRLRKPPDCRRPPFNDTAKHHNKKRRKPPPKFPPLQPPPNFDNVAPKLKDVKSAV